MEIPQKVKEAAKELIITYGDNIAYIGEYNGKATYEFSFRGDTPTGFPVIYLYDGKDVEEVIGVKTLKIIQKLFKE